MCKSFLWLYVIKVLKHPQLVLLTDVLFYLLCCCSVTVVIVSAGAEVVGCDVCLGQKVWRTREGTRSSRTVTQCFTTGSSSLYSCQHSPLGVTTARGELSLHDQITAATAEVVSDYEMSHRVMCIFHAFTNSRHWRHCVFRLSICVYIGVV